MKTKIITTLLLLLPVLGFTQSNSSIDFIGGIDYSYRHLTTNYDDIMLIIIENRSGEEWKLNWRTGFNYNRRLSNRMYLKSGLRFTNEGYKSKKTSDLRWGTQHDGMGHWIDTPDDDLPGQIQYFYNNWFIEIPIALRYEFNEKKWTPFVEAGVSPSLFLTRRTATKTDLGTDIEYDNGEFYNFNKMHLVGFASFGINYSPNNKYQFFGQPAFRYHLTKLVGAPIGEHLFNIGLEIGVRRKLG